jgi:exopolyphosphatase/guanosine-5'-triphosphate,3'-diphosphate pyrophosphatase
MSEHSLLAAVDLGSNSFHLQIARVVGDQVYPLDSLRDPVRIGAGLTADKRLDAAAQQRALACLAQFGERLRGMPPDAVRAVGTNTLRVAKNARAFLADAERALGFPIEVIAGREEARLIYLGVAHSLPASRDKRLVIDIGGGSTEFIIGAGLKPQRLESLYMGCVSFSLRYFPDGEVSRAAFREAELAARGELQTIRKAYRAGNWSEAIGSSGTARALGELLELNGYSESGITLAGLEQLKSHILRAGVLDARSLPGLRADRIPVLPGGLAIMLAAFDELGIPRMTMAVGSMRLGILYDMLGRFHHHDMRDVTVAQFMQRYHVDASQARRVGVLARTLFTRFAGERIDAGSLDHALHLLGWATKLHEIGLSIAYTGYHKHSSYIIRNADMPGFSRPEQSRLALLLLAQRGSLDKVRGALDNPLDLALVLALRLACLFHRSRSDLDLPALEARLARDECRLRLGRDWLADNPLTAGSLREESAEWRKMGVTLEVQSLETLEEAA